MLKINPITINTDYKKHNPANKPSFKAENPMQKTEIALIQNDFAVKTPITYQKTGELNLPFDTKAHCYKLANGQKVVIVPKDGSTVVKTYVNTGSMNEPDRIRGISHYIEHNLFNGSEGLNEGDFFKIVDKMGASTNASTGFAETNYYIKSHLLNPDDLEKKIKIQAAMIETPLFAVEKLQKEKGIVNSEINMITSDPQNIGVNRVIKNLFNIKSTSSDLIGGTTSNITNLTREDVVEYFSKNYYPANMVTVISGEVNPDETIKLVSKYFTSKKTPSNQRHFEKLIPLQKTVREDIISDKAAATSIIMGFKGPANNNYKDAVYSTALSILLAGSNTSRINKHLKPLNTEAWFDAEKISSNPSDNTALLLTADTTEETSEKVLKTIFEQIQNLKNNPPTDEELKIIKKKMLKSFSNSFEMSEPTNAQIADAFMNNTVEKLNDFEKIVNAMTSKDLVSAAEKYMDLNKTSITVIHPDKANSDTIKQNYGVTNNIAFTGSHKTALSLENVKEYNFRNNFKVVTHDIKSRNSGFEISFITDIPKHTKPAVPFVLNRILNEGSAYRDDQSFSHDMEKSGIDISFEADDTGITAYGLYDADDMEKALKSAKEVLLTPRFKQDTLEQVKSDIRESIHKSEKSVFQNLNHELFKGHLKGLSNEEILKSLDTVTLNDVQELYFHIIQNAKAKAVASAPFSKKPELTNILFNEIGQMNQVKEFKPCLNDTYTSVEKTKVITDISNKNQAEIVEAYKYKVTGNIKDTITVELLNNILGGGPSSRLFNDLREKQKLAYSVRSNLDGKDNSNVLRLFIKTTTENKETGEISYENLSKSINGFNKHIKNLINENVTDEELNNAKLSLKNAVLSGNESNYGKNDTISYSLNTIYGLNRENMLYDLIDTITANDIRKAANYIFKNKPVYSILATENTLKNNAEFLKSLEN